MAKFYTVAARMVLWLVIAAFYILSYPPSAALPGTAMLFCYFWAALLCPIPQSYRLVRAVRREHGVDQGDYGPWLAGPVSWPLVPSALLSVVVLFPACLWHAIAVGSQAPITGAWLDTAILLAGTAFWSTAPDLLAVWIVVHHRARRARLAGLPDWRADGHRGWSRRAPRRTSAHDAALLHAETIVARRDR